MALAATLTFLGTRAIPGLEEWTGERYTRVLRAPHGPGLVRLSAGDGHVTCLLRVADQRDLVTVVARVRRLLDLDADPVAVDEALATDVRLAPLVLKRPGLRSPGAVDGLEMAVRAVVGQQISVRGARTVLGHLVRALGEPAFDGEPWLMFPAADALAEADASALRMPRARAATVRGIASALAGGGLVLDPGADRDETTTALRALPGIGPWTADYLRMRALGDPDVLLGTDLGVRDAAAALDLDLRDGRPTWAPWRSYATHHLWATLS
jgi:AraC family transcriptional regulator of adaptative response / DNA-3-methyladenine glycosylase II